MSGDGTFRVEITYAPETADDTRPYRARIFAGEDDLVDATVWGSTRDLAVLHAREWVKSRGTHGETEEIIVDSNGDVMPTSLRVVS